MYFVYVGSGGVMTAGTDWMSYGSELEEGLLDDDRLSWPLWRLFCGFP